MNDEKFEATLSELKKSSQASLSLVILGALCLIGSLIYSATRLTPLEDQIVQKSLEIERLARTEAEYRENIESAKKEYSLLKENIEQLYAVKVTSKNRVYEIKAAAKATDKVTSQGSRYSFSIFVNSSYETLESIKKVTYDFDHPTFREPIQSSSNVSNRFSVGYIGWGCLTAVGIKVELNTGEKYDFNFNMCKSLGPQWGNVPEKPNK